MRIISKEEVKRLDCPNSESASEFLGSEKRKIKGKQ